MKRSKIIQLDGHEIVLKELTVQEIADCMDAVAGGAVDVLDLLMPGQLPSEAVVRSSGVERAELQGFPPSDLELLWEAAGEVNPFFLRMVAAPEAGPEKPSAKPPKLPARS